MPSFFTYLIQRSVAGLMGNLSSPINGAMHHGTKSAVTEGHDTVASIDLSFGVYRENENIFQRPC